MTLRNQDGRTTIREVRRYKRSARKCEFCEHEATRAVEVLLDDEPFEPYILCNDDDCWLELAEGVGA